MRVFTAVFAALAVAFSAFFSFQPQSWAAPLSISMEKGAEKPVSPALGGSSIVLTYKDQWAGISAEDEIAPLPPRVLRFPAGTHAMYFDWETGNYSGVKITTKRELSGYGIDKFFSLAARYNADVSYIVNIYRDSPEKTGRLASRLKASGYKVRYWELGNENYSPLYSTRFPNAEAYLAVARAHADEILKVFPDAEFGVTADPRAGHLSMWNAVLARQTFFKNIIIHKYLGPEKAKREALLKKGIQPDPAAAYSNMLKDSDPASEPNFICRFDGKRFWTTEYGLLYIGFDLQNSMAHAIWMARTFMKQARTARVDMMSYWNLNARPFELIEPIDRGFIHRVPFHAYTLMLKALSGKTVTAPAVFKGEGAPYMSGQYFRNSDKVSIMTVNAGPKSRILNVPEAGSTILIEYIGAESIEASNGYSQAFTPALRRQKTERVKPVTLVTDGASVIIPGYSVALISFDVK